MNSLLPNNATPVERALEGATNRPIPVPLRELDNADACPLPLLPFLAWADSIDTWSADWSEAVKRAQVRAAPEIHRRKGTAAAVHSVVQSFGGSVAIREWWQTTPRGDPHTFDLVLNLTGSDGEAATAEFVDQVIEAVRLVKPLRSHFTFTQGIRSEGDVGVLGRARVVRYERLQFNVSAGDNPEPDPVLLMEDGSALLLESGLGGLLLEDNP